jgi:hypothetical protein
MKDWMSSGGWDGEHQAPNNSFGVDEVVGAFAGRVVASAAGIGCGGVHGDDAVGWIEDVGDASVACVVGGADAESAYFVVVSEGDEGVKCDEGSEFVVVPCIVVAAAATAVGVLVVVGAVVGVVGFAVAAAGFVVDGMSVDLLDLRGG